MYRIGHGDCFLLAFDGDRPERPVYVLIDCGYKPGSPKHINTQPKEVVADIAAATGGHIDIAIITHEHQDHVNAISAEGFKDVTIGESWFAWTEDPDDPLADRLRRKFKDKLLGLAAAREGLARLSLGLAADAQAREAVDARLRMIDDLADFELGEERDELEEVRAPLTLERAKTLLAADGQSSNKRAMKVFKDKAENGVRFIRPHGRPLVMKGAPNVRVFALGPPRDEDLLESLNPKGEESFHALGLVPASPGASFAAAAMAHLGTDTKTCSPFAQHYCVPWDEALASDSFFQAHYGRSNDGGAADGKESLDDAPWRRIDHDWLASADALALDMNNDTNNSSLVLAFELGRGGKVLLFAADAQRGNWISWSREDWKAKDESGAEQTVTARELLARTVLYKVGHHCSHNATLNGTIRDTRANLSWMGQGEHAREFTAMITAVREWAETQKGWDHPQKAIKDALLKKAGGRVLQTDTDLTALAAPSVSDRNWTDFMRRTTGDQLYFDHAIEGG